MSNRRMPPHRNVTRHQAGPTPTEVNALMALHQAGQWAQLEAEARKMVAHHPGNPLGWTFLGLALQGAGRLPEAVAAFAQAVRFAPQDAGAHGNLGAALKATGRHAEAEASYRKALVIQPNHAGLHYNLGNLLRNSDRLAEAEASYRRALDIRPDYVAAQANLGNVLQHLGRLAEAETALRRVLEIGQDSAKAHNNQGRLLFSLNYQDQPAGACRDEALKYGRLVSAKVRARFSAWSCTERPDRLRLGLVSGDLRRHPVGYFLEGVLAHLDLARVELFAYSTIAKEDDLTDRLRPRFSEWKQLSAGDETAARQIHADGVHVLIDLSGHTEYNRLPVFAWKPAPVQATWLGYWATTGVAEMDWFLAAVTDVPPMHRERFTEQIWYLPDTRLCFTPPDTDLPVATLPALERGFVTFGSFQKQSKISDEVLRIWGRILAACPGSRLRLQDKSVTDTQTAALLRERMEAQGIALERVDLHGAMPRREYLAAHAEVDILLDTFPFTGGTTTCEALWMGVPTLTLAGETLIARQGASLLTAAGLPEWTAADDDEYVAKAVAFASDLEALAELRAGLRQRVLASPLFDAPRFARNLEDALWGMWEKRRPEAGSRVRMA